jgi:hypothetical protein
MLGTVACSRLGWRVVGSRRAGKKGVFFGGSGRRAVIGVFLAVGKSVVFTVFSGRAGLRMVTRGLLCQFRWMR